MTGSPLNVVTAVISAIGAALTVYYGGRAALAKSRADAGQRQLDGVKTSVDSLEAALVRSDSENVRLRADLERLRAEFMNEQRICHERITRLSEQVLSLGGHL